MGLNHTCEHNPHGYPFVALWTYSIIGGGKVEIHQRRSHLNPLAGDRSALTQNPYPLICLSFSLTCSRLTWV